VKEIALIKNILAEGIEKKVFKRMEPNLSAMIIFYAIKGLEVPYIRQNISEEFEKTKTTLLNLYFRE